MFLGKSFGICLSPRLEQSTTAPEAEQEQGAGHASAPNVVLTTKNNDNITTKCRETHILPIFQTLLINIFSENTSHY